MPLITIMTLFRNARRCAANYVKSILESVRMLRLNDQVEFLFIDDASDPQEGTVDVLLEGRRQSGMEMRILRFKERQHYTRGFAVGLSAARGAQVLFLSHDMVVPPSYLKTILAVSALDESYGIVRGTGTLVDANPEHDLPMPLPARDYRDIISYAKHVSEYYGLTHVVDRGLTGDAMLIKRSVLQKIGVFDTRYYGYFGDVDYGLRTQRAGFKLICAKGAWLMHEGAAHYREEQLRTQQDPQEIWNARMKVVGAAYRVFREKWDLTLPPEYPGSLDFGIEKMQHLPPSAGSEYEAPIAVDPKVSEWL